MADKPRPSSSISRISERMACSRVNHPTGADVTALTNGAPRRKRQRQLFDELPALLHTGVICRHRWTMPA